MPDVTRAELKYFVERQREEIKMLNEVGGLLSSTTDPHEIARLAASYLNRAFPVALCGILVLPHKKLHMIPATSIAQVEIINAVKSMRFAHQPDGGASVRMRPSRSIRSRANSRPLPSSSCLK